MIKVVNQVYDNIDNKHISILMLTDLSKAFDSVNHNILLSKAIHMGIDQFWFENYLSNRTQYVKINNTRSTSLSINFGVPQGSILGPTLFSIYVNDMKSAISNALLVQYADDSQLLLWAPIRNFDCLVKQAEATLDRVRQYYLSNGLLINTSKTQCIVIGTTEYLARLPKDPVLKVDNKTINFCSSVTSLGVVLDQTLSFRDHISYAARKSTSALVQINAVRDLLIKPVRNMLVKSLVFSGLFYGLKVWGNAACLHMNKIQKVQNFAARVVAGNIGKFDRVTPTIQSLGWLKVHNRYKYELAILAFKILHHLTPAGLFCLRRRENVSGVTTRQSHHLSTAYHRTTIGSRQIETEMANLWNILPQDLIACNTLPSFKRKISKFLQDLQ